MSSVTGFFLHSTLYLRLISPPSSEGACQVSLKLVSTSNCVLVIVGLPGLPEDENYIFIPCTEKKREEKRQLCGGFTPVLVSLTQGVLNKCYYSKHLLHVLGHV